MEDTESKVIKFADIKKDLLDELNRKIIEGDLKFTEKVNIVEGFVSQPLAAQISSSFVLGGPTIPMVMVAGEKTGQIHFFALRVLMPHIFE